MYMYVNVFWLFWLQFFCLYVFYFVVFLMGVVEDDCFEVVKLIGDKMFINEFYVYIWLFVYIKNRENFMWYGYVLFKKKKFELCLEE